MSYPLGVIGSKSNLSTRKKVKRIIQKLRVRVLHGEISFNDTLMELIRVALNIPVDTLDSCKSFTGEENPVLNELASAVTRKQSKLLIKRGTQLKIAHSNTHSVVDTYNAAQKTAVKSLQASIRGFIHRKRILQLLEEVSKSNADESGTVQSSLQDMSEKTLSFREASAENTG